MDIVLSSTDIKDAIVYWLRRDDIVTDNSSISLYFDDEHQDVESTCCDFRIEVAKKAKGGK